MYRAGQEEIDAVAEVIRSRQWFRVGDPAKGHLQQVVRFEEEWAAKMGADYAVLMCGGGTAALVCALAGAGIGPGDEVIVPAYTWMASATSVLTVGAIPVLADVDETLGLDPEALKRRIGPRTRAVIPVHMAGRPAALEPILTVARESGIKVIEDSCQMVGGTYRGKRTGTWGDAGAYSFNYYKIISAGGEGGCLVTSDRDLFERAFIYHDSGAAFRPKAGELRTPIFVSQQYRADEVMGAIARVQMQRMDGIIGDLRRWRAVIADGVADGDKVREAPSNDPEGDCGVMAAFQFPDEARARRFVASPGVGGLVLIDHGKHVYTQWEPLRNQRIGHHPAMNPFHFAENRDLRMDYSDEVCAGTLSILRRSVFIGVNPDWTEAEALEKREALRKAAAAL